MTRTSSPRTATAIRATRSAFDRRAILLSAIALSLGLAGFAASRAQAETAAGQAAVASTAGAHAGEPAPIRWHGAATAYAAAPESAPRDESNPWSMLAAGALVAGVIARRRTH